MGNDLKDLMGSKGARDVLVVSVGRGVASGLGFLATIVLARRLGPQDFGLFSLSLAIMMVISGIAGGSIDQAIVKFSSFYLKKDRERAESIFKTTFKLKIIIAFILLFAGFIFNKPLSRIVFNDSGSGNLINLSFMGSISIILLGFVLAFLQSHQTFGKHVFLELLNNIMKLGFIGILVLVNVLNPVSSMAVFAMVPFLTFMLGLKIIPRNFLRAGRSGEKLLPEIIHFSKWIVLSYIIFALYRRMDIFLLNHFAEFRTVGIYSAAFNIASILDLVALSFFVVIFPKVSRFTTRNEYVDFVKRFLIGAIPLYLFVCILLWVVSKPLVAVCYTSEFIGSVSILRILVPGFAVYLIALPLSAIILSRNKPQLLVAYDFIALLIMFSGGIFLIPSYGAEGVAVASLISHLIFMALVIVGILNEIKNIPPEENGPVAAR
jgi:O-antigen/teichoic acid export membrane protein